jgi:probable HAF family extracellular repeat protein
MLSSLARGALGRTTRVLLLSSSMLVAVGHAQADDFQGLGFLPGDIGSSATGISADGTVVVGSSAVGMNSRGFRWSGGTLANLGTLGGTSTFAYGVSADGAVVVGVSGLGAFRWSNGVMTNLGTLGGSNSFAYGVSGDGAVVVGESQISGNSAGHAFRWSGGTMSDLGTLGGTNSVARGASADGAVVVGYSNNTGNTATRAFRWSGGVMADLGTLGGIGAIATGVSANGSVVVGNSTIAGNAIVHGFRWNGGAMADLGTLGGTNSYANAVSADGTVVVGSSDIAGNPAGSAFRWTASTGMKSIQGLLTGAGVSMSGWSLTSATAVSADGSVIVGSGTDPSGNTEAWLARCIAACGFITASAVSQSFAGQSAMGQTGNAAIGGSLGTFTEIATQAGNTKGGSRFSAFGYGGYDSDPAASGTLGMTVKLTDAMVAGVALSANYIRTNMVYDGSSKMSGGSAGVFVARVPDVGLQWLLGVNGMTLKGDVTRGYLNGNSLASSTGSTAANGYGITARVGWTFDQIWRATQVTPFASYTYSQVRFDGYTETGGPFPAQFNAFTDRAQTSRLGADARYTLAPGKWLWGTLAWAHRLDGGKGADVSGTVIGLFGMTATGASVAKDWAEATAGVRLPAWKNGALTASLTASIPANFPTTYVARVGVTQAF